MPALNLFWAELILLLVLFTPADALYLGVEAADLVLTCSPALAGLPSGALAPADVDLSGPAQSAPSPPPGGDNNSWGALLSAWQVGYQVGHLVLR
jgi:hypothetical protein